MRKSAFCICENKDPDQLHSAVTAQLISASVTAQLISAFVFPARIVKSLFFLNPKFQASSHLLWLCSPVCVGPGRKPRRPVLSQRGSYNKEYLSLALHIKKTLAEQTIRTVFDENSGIFLKKYLWVHIKSSSMSPHSTWLCGNEHKIVIKYHPQLVY